MGLRAAILAVGAVAVLALALIVAAEPPPLSSVVTASSATAPALHAVVVRKPAGPPRVQTGIDAIDGRSGTIACGTCHTTRLPDLTNRTGADLDQFHQGLAVAHGDNSCLNCHNGQDYDSLHLADGRRVEFTEVMQLCAQCHGPQYRDWQHGAHGGMNGFWDLKAGGRVRQNCTGCHDPHVPKYQQAIPMPPPHDRFQAHTGTHGADHE